MALETGTYISDLVSTNPTSSDPKSQGDDHIRLIKATAKATLPNLSGAMTASHAELNILDGATLSTAELNILDGVTSTAAEINILDGVTLTVAELNSLTGITGPAAAKNGETFTGANSFTGATITVPTQAAGDSSTKAASTEFVASTAFSSALPAQTGNDYKLISTNGAVAAWYSYIKSTVMRWADGTDITKLMSFDLSGLTTATTRTVTVANNNITLDSPGWRLLSVTTAASSATVDIETTFDSTYNRYILEVDNFTAQTTTADLLCRMKIGGSYLSTATYSYTTVTTPVNSAISIPINAAGASSGKMVASLQVAANVSTDFEMFVNNPTSTAYLKKVTYQGSTYPSTAAEAYFSGIISNSGTAALTGIRFLMSSGNIVTGNFRLYGLRKTI